MDNGQIVSRIQAGENTGRNKGFIGYREEFLSAASIHHVGVRSFQYTWTSEVEREALRF